MEKENITDVLENNKITTNKLTSDLETALQINKNAVAEKEKQIAALKASADQAKTNWESINPNASDLLYMEQYETLMKQLTAKSQELQQNQERLTALKNALTLHDLSNVGENAMAIGTNSLSTGSNSIAIGTGSIVTGENSISIGKGSAVTGTKSIAVGVGHIVIGNNSGTFGDPNTIYGDNSYAFGNNNTIGNSTTTHTVGTNTFVLGSNVTTKANNSVILGKDSVATEDNVVSIGSNTSTRKLVNVTDGTIAENSKEAINGNQLWKVSEAKDGAINKTAWQAALGTGKNAAGNTGLVTGDTLHAALANVQIDPSTLTSKANKDASNITSDDAKKWSEKLGTGSVAAGDKGLVTGGTVNTAITNAVNTATSNINSGIKTKLNGKANINASNLTNENVKEWTSKLGVGTVGQGDSSNGLVTGKSVYEAIHKYTPKGLVQTDGKVVTVDKSGTANQIDFSGTDKNGNSILREITGVITNPNDPNSVVNMDTLQSQTQGLNQKLTKAVNVGTATASALAALHPLDYDEANKVSFAVSHGQYNGSKATAFGGFVRPNENIMLSLASTINSNDRAWNAGLSFKIGSGSSHKKVSQNDFEALRNKNDKLENELNQLKEQLSKLSTRLSAKRTSFPDVPNDHWAKEAVETLHGNDVLDGYPDGEFKGDKQLTRYEYAQMLFKGLK
ncbi:S-layer homology domain-containing protein [Veillonella sp. oral taxon 780]|uniref:S-layer homology domain-containing protein n=1 Tax=Veillonella sp. oral taxon 780 TaxID=671229 RepID=UPI00021A35BC|nr:S-layer homology domain-containing protein [Veillonella sp. oral taxon 780]EGS34661.1 YadA-like C-terminal domain protein [Veillonella sp. oral taxon 780 str. F0422]